MEGRMLETLAAQGRQRKDAIIAIVHPLHKDIIRWTNIHIVFKQQGWKDYDLVLSIQNSGIDAGFGIVCDVSSRSLQYTQLRLFRLPDNFHDT